MKMIELLNRINETTTVKEIVDIINEASQTIDDPYELELFCSEVWRRFTQMRR